MANTSASSGGLGFTGLLFLVFLVLKLTKVIDWSWLWVCAPLWIPIVVILIGAVILVVVDYAIRKL